MPPVPPVGLRLLNLLLFGACCLQTARVTNALIADSLHSPAAAVAAEPAAAGAARPEWAERTPILERNLFAAQLAGDAPAVVEVFDEDVEETRLPLSLVGTLASTGPSARAAILDTRTRKSLVLQAGDELEGHPQVRIDRIERGRVLLINRGRREELLLAEVEDGAQPTPPAATAERRPRRVDRPPTRRTAPDPDRFKARRQQVREDPRHRERLEQLRDRLEQAGLDPDSRLAALEEEAEAARERVRRDPDAMDALEDDGDFVDEDELYLGDEPE